MKKASNFNLKSLNRCFSNYYRVRTMHIFAEPVTYVKELTGYEVIDWASVFCQKSISAFAMWSAIFLKR